MGLVILRTDNRLQCMGEAVWTNTALTSPLRLLKNASPTVLHPNYSAGSLSQAAAQADACGGISKVSWVFTS